MFAACAGGARLLLPRVSSRRAPLSVTAWTSRRRAEPRTAKPATEKLAAAPASAKAKPAAPKVAKRPEGEAAPREGQWTVDEESHRLRVDRYLRAVLGGASQKSLDRCVKRRSRRTPNRLADAYATRSAVRAGALTLNGERVPSLSFYVKRGDVVALAPLAAVPDASALIAAASAINWRSRILYEDAVLLVIDKPAGFASAPAKAEPVSALSCMESTLRARDGAAAPKELYPLHRLDKPTSGVLMLAKDSRICAPVSRALRMRGVSKQYWALLSGSLPGPDSGSWSDRMELGGSGKSFLLPADAPEGEGKTAKAGFAVVERLGSVGTVVRLTPTTGRMHQLRVQTSARGAAIVGDDRYGVAPPANRAPPPRLFLHCERMAMRHPDTDAELEFTAPLPEELAVYLLRLRKAGRSTDAAQSATA
jgi:RluA family pseudouridine synthase